ncbi:tetratricopeptide repeat protein [Cognaticolwellia mytili]|uniref:tetratricopeptide repeat protein n=1 Tax=Cognaticolwellia mytili TaxID=1888913 RepID=UPI001301D1BD|nr:tetratricopeptide repeat protein [Cognaticolwellia mytili]
MEEFLAQLRQRQVFKVATIYAVSAWPLIQIADLAVPALGLPDSVMTLLLKIFIAGFPVSLIFAWLFNFTNKGIVRAESANSSEGTNNVNLRTTLTVAGSLILALAVTLLSQLFFSTPQVLIEPIAPPLNELSRQIDQENALKSNKESIAILPFVALSSDPEDEYFADGMVEELLNLLAKNSELQVAARTSSFAYKNVTKKTIPEIGRELGVDTILEGSIRKNDTNNKIRVTAQLIKVSTGEHIWSETYDREYRDVFQIQDEIANAVVDKLKVTLLGKPISEAHDKGTNSINAMVAYGKGQKELAHRTAASLTKALSHFQAAVAADDEYARAYIGVANANVLLALYGTLPKEEANKNAQAAIDKAFSLDAQLVDAHATQGLLFSSTNRDKAEASFKQAIDLNPNFAMTYMWYGSFVQKNGDIAGAHKLFEQAFELDPQSPVAAYNVAWCYYQEGNEGKAMTLFSQIIANDPYYPGAYNLAGDILRTRGRLDESLEMYERALQVDSGNKGAIKGLLLANMDMNNQEDTQQWFTYLNDHTDLFSKEDVIFLQSRFAASKGKNEQALALLEQVEFDEPRESMSLYVAGEIAFYRENYPQAITAYEQLFTIDKENMDYRYRFADGQAALHLSYAYQQLEQTAKVNALISNFEQYLLKKINNSSNKPEIFYNMTLIKALQNDDGEAYSFFQSAIDSGWVQTWKVGTEPILSALSKTQRFKQMFGGVSARLENMKLRVKEQGSFLLVDNL